LRQFSNRCACRGAARARRRTARTRVLSGPGDAADFGSRATTPITPSAAKIAQNYYDAIAMLLMML